MNFSEQFLKPNLKNYLQLNKLLNSNPCLAQTTKQEKLHLLQTVTSFLFSKYQSLNELEAKSQNFFILSQAEFAVLKGTQKLFQGCVLKFMRFFSG